MKYDAAGVGANYCQIRGIFVKCGEDRKKTTTAAIFCGCESEKFVYFFPAFPLVSHFLSRGISRAGNKKRTRVFVPREAWERRRRKRRGMMMEGVGCSRMQHRSQEVLVFFISIGVRFCLS